MIKLPSFVNKVKIPGLPGLLSSKSPYGENAEGDEAVWSEEDRQSPAVNYAHVRLTEDGKLPLQWRLRAWWDGFDAEAIAGILGKYQTDSDEAADTPEDGEEEEAAGPPEADPTEIKPIDPDDWMLPFDPWDPNRLEVAQYIWGEGFCGVGGPSHVVNTCKLLALKPEMSVMEFGSGLGAAARALVEGFGCWITGYEESGRVVEYANHKSHMLGLGKKAKIDMVDLADPAGFGRNYDRVVSRLTLHRYKNKDKIVKLINQHTKPTGLVLAMDFVVPNDDTFSDPEFKEWIRQEPFTPFLLSAKNFSKLFSDCDFVVRVDEDVTQEYVRMINQAWQGADDLVQRLQYQPDGPDLITVLMRHGELWHRRAKLMKAGKLKLWRVMGTKVGGRPEAMSDW